MFSFLKKFRKNKQEIADDYDYREKLRNRDFYIQSMLCLAPGEEELWRTEPARRRETASASGWE